MRTARSLRCERACMSVRLLSARANVLTPQRARGAGGCARKRACACMCAGLRLSPLATKRAKRRGKGAALPQRPEPRGDELARNWRGHRGRGGGGIRPARATARASRQGSSTGRGRAPTMVEALARVTALIISNRRPPSHLFATLTVAVARSCCAYATAPCPSLSSSLCVGASWCKGRRLSVA